MVEVKEVLNNPDRLHRETEHEDDEVRQCLNCLILKPLAYPITHIALPPTVGQLISVYSLLVIEFLKVFMNLAKRLGFSTYAEETFRRKI